MSEKSPDNFLHETFYNELLKTESKKFEKLIEPLNMKITNLKTEVMLMNKINQSLRCKLNSTNNMLRILTSSRELEFDTIEVDRFVHNKLITQNQKVKPVTNVNSKIKGKTSPIQTSKIPVSIKPSKKNFVKNNKENVSSAKNATSVNKKAKLNTTKSGVKKSKESTLSKNNVLMENRVKKVDKAAALKKISLNKTYKVGQ